VLEPGFPVVELGAEIFELFEEAEARPAPIRNVPMAIEIQCE